MKALLFAAVTVGLFYMAVCCLCPFSWCDDDFGGGGSANRTEEDPVCPDISGRRKRFSFCFDECSGDNDCGEGQLCCSDGCGKSCIYVNKAQDCPYGIRSTCYHYDACDATTCPANPGATCENYDCGGCFAKFKDEAGNYVNCNPGGFHPHCGKDTYDSNFGEITSPGYPGRYPDLATCRVVVNAPPGNTIILTFLEFNVEGNPGCTFDVLKIYDGDGGFPRFPLLAHLCGTDLPPTITSTESSVLLEFYSDVSINKLGYRIEYRTVPIVFNCTFDADLCGFTQDTDDDFDWRRHDGHWNFPSSDVSGSGYYMHVDYYMAGTTAGATALLRSPTVQSDSTTGFCLQFHYHMYGEEAGTLNVYVTDDGSSALSAPVFNVTGDQGEDWLRERVDIAGDTDFQVVFEGISGPGPRSHDTAVDEVVIFGGSCTG